MFTLSDIKKKCSEMPTWLLAGVVTVAFFVVIFLVSVIFTILITIFGWWSVLIPLLYSVAYMNIRMWRQTFVKNDSNNSNEPM